MLRVIRRGMLFRAVLGRFSHAVVTLNNGSIDNKGEY